MNKSMEQTIEQLWTALNKTQQDLEAAKETANLVWQMRSCFLVLTMQSGFALLEAGCVSLKNITNIMIKNVIDVIFGALVWWSVGFAFSFGEPASPFTGYGYFFLHDLPNDRRAELYTLFMFQFSFASTATTMVSGAVAERFKLQSYVVFSTLNTLSYCFPVQWTWQNKGFLRKLGFYDFAGATVVHANGGAAALAALIIVGHRTGRFVSPEEFETKSPVTALTGTLILYWSWFGFNTGSTGGVSNGLMVVNSLVAINTVQGSVGGAIAGTFTSMILHNGKLDVGDFMISLLGGLVAITGVCSVCSPTEAFVVGLCSAPLGILTHRLLIRFRLDDVVSAVPVHLTCGIFGTLATGLIGHDIDGFHLLNGRSGLFYSGSPKQLGMQCLGVLCICTWSFSTTAVFLLLLRRTIGLRLTVEEERQGADLVHHGIRSQEQYRAQGGSQRGAAVYPSHSSKVDQEPKPKRNTNTGAAPSRHEQETRLSNGNGTQCETVTNYD